MVTRPAWSRKTGSTDEVREKMYDKGLGDTPVQSPPHRQCEGHQAVRQVHSQSSGKLCTLLMKEQPCVLTIPGSPSAMVLNL